MLFNIPILTYPEDSGFVELAPNSKTNTNNSDII